MSEAVLRTAAGDASISSGGLALDLRGLWTATVEIHGEAALEEGEDASIVLHRESGAEDVYTGKVRRSALDDGALRVSVTVEGAPGLAAELGPLDHAAGATEVPLGLVVKALVDAAGEELEEGVEAALDALTVPHWLRAASTGREALDLLCEVLELSWRVRPSGKVWIGGETWPEAPAPLDLGFALEDGGTRYTCDGAEIVPGTVVGGRRLVRVVYLLGGPLVAEARAAVAGDRGELADRTAYTRPCSATVVAQDATTGLLELQPDAPALGSADASIRGVPLRVGIPGCRVTVPAGARVRLAFDGADPRFPFASALDQDASAAASLALVGDSAGWISGVAPAGGGPVTLSWSATSTGATGEVEVFLVGPGHRYAKGVPG